MSSHRRAIASFAAVIHQLEKDQKRRREAAQKRRAQMPAEKNATEAILAQEELLREFTSLHVDGPLFIDWQNIKNEPSPAEPKRFAEAEEAANAKFEQFQPSWIDKLVGYKRKMKKL